MRNCYDPYHRDSGTALLCQPAQAKAREGMRDLFVQSPLPLGLRVSEKNRQGIQLPAAAASIGQHAARRYRNVSLQSTRAAPLRERLFPPQLHRRERLFREAKKSCKRESSRTAATVANLEAISRVEKPTIYLNKRHVWRRRKHALRNVRGQHHASKRNKRVSSRSHLIGFALPISVGRN